MEGGFDMFCPNCGQELIGSVDVCTACNTHVYPGEKSSQGGRVMSFKKAVIFLVMFTVTALLLAGCGKSTPSESLGKKVLQDAINKSCCGDCFCFHEPCRPKSCSEFMRVKSFKKTNGIEAGGMIYGMLFEADIEFLKDVEKLHALPYVSKDAKAGDVRKGKGRMTFVKTENGWQGEIKLDVTGFLNADNPYNFKLRLE